MTGLRSVLVVITLAGARFRRRPSRWLLPALGIAIAIAFACVVAGEGTVAGDRAAHQALAALPRLQRTVVVTAQGDGRAVTDRRARRMLHDPALSTVTRAVLLNPVRLGRTVVRLAAIAPLGRWVAGAPRVIGVCRVRDCPLLLVGGGSVRGSLSISGADIRRAGTGVLSSPVPLGFVPGSGDGLISGQAASAPLLIGGDVAGLDRLPGVGGVFRTDSWLAELRLSALHSWNLDETAARLRRGQIALAVADPSLTVTAPLDALQAARARASEAPRRLWLAGGGAAAVLVAFVLLAAGALRADVAAESARLRTAGASSLQRVLLAVVEAVGVSALAAAAGTLGGVAAVIALAANAREPVGAILSHSLVSGPGAVVLIGGWLLCSALLAAALLAPAQRDRRGPLTALDVLALAALAALALSLARGGSSSGNDPLPLLLAPLSCLAAGALILRLAGATLRAAERSVRRAPLVVRLAAVNLARAPAPAAGAIAFVAISVGLGGFALTYRATLGRSAVDQAADRVPLDVTVSTGPSFVSPLMVAPLGRWQSVTHGTVAEIRRSEATVPAGAATSTLPLIGLPAGDLPLLRSWRDSDASAGRPALARRLVPPGPVRHAGPRLAAAARTLVLSASAAGLEVQLTADLRSPSGLVWRAPLGSVGAAVRELRAALPPGAWELQALELNESAGLDATAAHQAAENAAGVTRSTAFLRVLAAGQRDAAGRWLGRLALGGWTAHGAALDPRPLGGNGLSVRFSATGALGLLRPTQPGDRVYLPVLVDRATGAQAGRGALLPLSVDGLAIPARVVGTLRRFPTVAADAAGFVVADQGALASRLDAGLPGQGRADELWLAAARLAPTRLALRDPRFAPLNVAYRVDAERALRDEPAASAVRRTLVAASVVALVLAAVGLLAVLSGAGRDRTTEIDLRAQGMGPRALRWDLRLRMLTVSGLGVLGGLVVAVALGRLSVAAVRAAAGPAPASPPLVTVVPWGELAVLAGAALLGLSVLIGVAVWRGPEATG